MAKDSCLAHVAKGAALGGALGSACGACFGTVEVIRDKIPGLLKIRRVGQRTLGTAVVFSLFLGAGSVLNCGRSY